MRSGLALINIRNARDHFQNTIQMSQYVVIGNTQYPNALGLNGLGTLLVVILSSIMAFAIQFNRKSRGRTIEIHDIGLNGVLPTESQATEIPAPQH